MWVVSRVASSAQRLHWSARFGGADLRAEDRLSLQAAVIRVRFFYSRRTTGTRPLRFLTGRHGAGSRPVAALRAGSRAWPAWPPVSARHADEPLKQLLTRSLARTRVDPSQSRSGRLDSH